MINIVSSADDKYAQHLGVMLTSIFKNLKLKNDIQIYIIDGGISRKNLKKLEKISYKYKSNFKHINIDQTKNLYENFHLKKGISPSIYYLISIPELIDLDKIIYLDCDILVNDDLAKLWKTDISNYYIAACDNFGYARKILNIPKGQYFNAGVMIINSKKWRNNNISNKVINWLHKHPHITRFYNQDALNATLYKKWLKLHPRWNVVSPYFEISHKDINISKEELLNIKENPGIIHFTGARKKPWHYWSNHPYKNLYYEYLYETPWKGYEPTNKSVKYLLIQLRRNIIPNKIRIKLKFLINTLRACVL